jgi:hypothetical protein
LLVDALRFLGAETLRVGGDDLVDGLVAGHLGMGEGRRGECKLLWDFRYV